jgi:hypothetical protein
MTCVWWLIRARVVMWRGSSVWITWRHKSREGARQVDAKLVGERLEFCVGFHRHYPALPGLHAGQCNIPCRFTRSSKVGC